MIDGVTNVLIVGGGVGGMATAIQLRKLGVAVDLIDLDPQWRAAGAGITMTAPTLRALQGLGMLDTFREHGAISGGTRMRTFKGDFVADVDEPADTYGRPATGGIMRPLLHRLMSEEVRRLGTDVRLGLTVDKIEDRNDRACVTFSDNTSGQYDLVIAADGIYSKVRALVFPDAVQPVYSGQGGWRMLADRPADMERMELYVGHKHMVGITPCATDKVYLWVMTTDPAPLRLPDDELRAEMRAILSDFGGNVASVRDAMTDECEIIYRPTESALQPAPWHRGRMVLLGDAAHATTPQLASGAGIAIEDALVLAEELARPGLSLDQRLTNHTERRFERCRFVLERSLEIGQHQIKGFSPQTGALVGEAMHRLAEPI